MNTYLVQTKCDGDVFSSVKTLPELASLYELEQEACFLDDLVVFDVSDFGHPVKVDVSDVVAPYLEQRRWMEQEYRDYCELVNEYGYNYPNDDLIL